MELGGGLAPTVLRPVDAGGYQRDGAGVDHMNDATKTPKLILYPDGRRQIPEKASGGARAPSRKAVQLVQRRGAYWREKDCYGSEQSPRARPKAGRCAAVA